MNIAHLLPHSAHFPLKKHNGRYEWALRLAREQVGRGHTVTIYAAPDSHDDIRELQWSSLPAPVGDKQRNNSALMAAAFHTIEHDIFHSHFDSLHYSLAHLTKKPIVCTQHWFPSEQIAHAAQTGTTENVYLVPVTHYMEQADIRLGLRPHEMIYHGIDLSLFTPQFGPVRDHLVFVGRITPSKGVREAVMLAVKTHSSLDIIGKVNGVDQGYWESVLPFVDGHEIRYHGALSQHQVAKFLRQAKAFLFPNQHEEAFGQVIIEAQASGTPVIVSDIGAARELVQQGVTGFICSSEHEFVEAFDRIDTLDRTACRTFAQHFSDRTMFDRYEALYESLVATDPI